MNNRITPKLITELPPDGIFVFGSNLAGRHGAGAALTARTQFGAEYGIGFGLTGQSYAIPTKDRNLKVLKLDEIQTYVSIYIEFAKQNPELTFYTTLIGCGLAGFKPEQIAPLFAKAVSVNNIKLPIEFWNGN